MPRSYTGPAFALSFAACVQVQSGGAALISDAPPSLESPGARAPGVSASASPTGAPPDAEIILETIYDQLGVVNYERITLARRLPKLARALGQYRIAQANAATGGDYDEVAALSARDFAAAIAARAAAATTLQSMLHPDIGVFVVHNVAGAVLHADRVTAWPKGDYDYSLRVSDSRTLAGLRGAARWGARREPSEDDSGCTIYPNHAYVVPGSPLGLPPFNLSDIPGTVFLDWALIHTGSSTPVPDEYRLRGWPDVRDALGDDIDEHEFAVLQRASFAITHGVRLNNARFDFGRISGRWYLLAMNIEDDACG